MRRAPDRRPARKVNGWEDRVLAALAYPANLAFAGVAGFFLCLGVVTWLSAWIAVGSALHGWSARDDDRVFTGTFREFARTWRRTLPASVVATVLVAVLGINILFLGQQDSPVALLFAMATVPVVIVLGLLVLTLPATAARAADASMREWLHAAVVAVVRAPLASLVLVVIAGAFGLTCVLLPTIVPFFGVSLPVWLGLVTVERTVARATPT